MITVSMLFACFIRYLRNFYEEIYHQANEKGELRHPIAWTEASKELKWQNQLNWYSFLNKDETTNTSEIMKKASAWFRVTYKWISNKLEAKKKGRNRKRKNRMTDQQQQNQELKNRKKSQPFCSFAWIVYPVLLEIYDEKQNSDNI